MLVRHTVLRVGTILVRTYRTIGKQHVQTQNDVNKRNKTQQNEPYGLVNIVQTLHTLRQTEPCIGNEDNETNQHTKTKTASRIGSRA